MKRKAENDSYESDVISLEYWQQPTRVHVIKYELCEAMSKIERDVQKRKNKWGIGRFDHDSILDEVHRVFYDLMYNKEHFLMRYLGPSL